MISIINDNDDVNVIQRKLEMVDILDIQTESFGITWRNDSKNKHRKKNNRVFHNTTTIPYHQVPYH